MESLQVFVLFLTFACALGGLLLAFRVERRVTKMFGSGNLKQSLMEFFGTVPDGEGGVLPPQAAFYAFCSNIGTDMMDHAIEQLPGALVSMKGSSFAKKAAKHSAFARGAQHLSEGGFGELNGLKEIGMEFMSKVGTGGKKGDLIAQLAPMFIEKMMNQSGNGGAGILDGPSQLMPLAGNSPGVGGKLGGN